MKTAPDASRKRFLVLLFFLLALTVASFIHLLLADIHDNDAFYHFRHAALYAERGIFMTGFPWIPYSVIDSYRGDIWYGFHLFLIPFTWIPNEILGLRLAGIAITTAFLIFTYLALRRHRVWLPFLWPFFALFAGKNGLNHLTMVRPHPLSTGLALLLFSFLVRGSRRAVFLTAFALAFFHLNLFWMVPLLLGIAALLEWGRGIRPSARTIIPALGGMLLGFLLNPNPWGTARVTWVQTGLLLKEKLSGLPLPFGSELLPFSFSAVNTHLMLFFLAWLFAGGAAFKALFTFVRPEPENAARRTLRIAQRKEPPAADEQHILLGTGILSAVFFLMSITIARRFSDLWFAFGTAWIAFAFTYGFCRKEQKEITSGKKPRLAAALLFVFLFAVLASASLSDNFRRWARVGDSFRLETVSLWLKANTPRDAIVYNVNWDLFGRLFFFNPENRYVAGMDPIFQFAYNQDLYWKSHYLTTGKSTNVTCGAPECTKDMLQDTYTVLTRDFKASYLLLEKQRKEKLYEYLKTDPRFVPAFETETEIIYALGETPKKRPGMNSR